jgi:hypothetical protein
VDWNATWDAVTKLDWDTIANISISIGTLLVAWIALRVAQAERASPQRAALYERMLDAHTELAVVMTELADAAKPVISFVEEHPEGSKEPLGQMGADLIAAATAFNKLAGKWAHVLPNRTLKATGAMWDAVLVAMDGKGARSEIDKARKTLAAEMRAACSVEPLTEANLRLTGQIERDESDRLAESLGGLTRALRRDQ